MARKKVNLGERILQGPGLLSDHDEAEALTRAVCALHHWADARGVSFLGATIDADRRYQSDLNSESVEGQSLAHSRRYTGWDRIHDSNKAEGRPVGNQWSDAGVRYVGGVKVHG